MGKRFKLSLSVSVCLISLSILIFSVWSFANSNFSLGFDLQYIPTLKSLANITGEVWLGANHSDAEQLVTPGNTLNIDIKDGNFSIVSSNASAFSAGESWNVPSYSLNSSYNENYIEYRLNITNISNENLTFYLREDVTALNLTFKEYLVNTLVIEPGETKQYILSASGDSGVSTNFTAQFELIKTDLIETNEAWFEMDSTTPTQLNGFTEAYNAAAPRILRVPETVGGQSVLSTDSNELLQPSIILSDNTKYLILPEGLKTIGTAAFKSSYVDETSNTIRVNNNLTSIYLPNTVEEIGRYSFNGLPSLTSINLSTSLGRIADSAFSGSSLKNIQIPNSVTAIDDHAFSMCESLENIELPDSLTQLGSNVFYFCSSLRSINLPASVTTIGSHVFVGCSSLKSAELPLLTMPNNAGFYNCTALTTVKFNGIANDLTAFTDYDNYFDSTNTALIKIELPYGLRTISPSAFRDCGLLQSVTIPNSVITIGYDAFAMCYLLTSIEIPASVASIGDTAFNYCRKLLITVDEDNANYSSVGGSLYDKDKTTLIRGAGKDVVDDIPNSVIRIEKLAFSGCSSITDIEMPNSVQEIGYYAFAICSSLTNIEIPASVTSIGSSAFSNCSNLVTIELPLLTMPDNTIFNGCKKLTSVKFIASEHGLKTFTDYDNYFNSTNTGLSSIELPSGLQRIEDWAIENNGLEMLTIPSSVTYIGASALEGVSCIYIPEEINLTSAYYFNNTDWNWWYYSESPTDDFSSLPKVTEIPAISSGESTIGYYYSYHKVLEV